MELVEMESPNGDEIKMDITQITGKASVELHDLLVKNGYTITAWQAATYHFTTRTKEQRQYMGKPVA